MAAGQLAERRALLVRLVKRTLHGGEATNPKRYCRHMPPGEPLFSDAAPLAERPRSEALLTLGRARARSGT
jgi:hypothetical protein